MFEPGPGLSKSDRTRARISETAVASFVARGYADTTMRAIAADAGVSVGNAYYYFPSKEHLVQDLYLQVQRDHAARARPLLAEDDGLVERLRIVMTTGLTTLEPYRQVAPGFLSAMFAPESPINPLSSSSSPARDMVVELFRDAVDGAKHRIPADVAALLPEALFLAYLAVVLRWTYDDSPAQAKTARLLDAALRLLSLALPFVRVPGVRHAVTEMLTLVSEVRA